MMNSLNNCDRYRDKVFQYIDNDLSDCERNLFDEHFKVCNDCRKVLLEAKAMLSAIRNMEEVEPPHDMTFRVMDKIKKRRFIKGFKRLSYIAASFILIISVVAIYGLYLSKPKETPNSLNQDSLMLTSDATFIVPERSDSSVNGVTIFFNEEYNSGKDIFNKLDELQLIYTTIKEGDIVRIDLNRFVADDYRECTDNSKSVDCIDIFFDFIVKNYDTIVYSSENDCIVDNKDNIDENIKDKYVIVRKN